MSMYASIPYFGSCTSMPTKLASTTIPTPPSTPGSSRRNRSSVVPLHSLAQLCGPSPRSSPSRTGIADLVVRVKASLQQSAGDLRTCRNCKKSFDSSQNNPRACRYHTAHFGGETKRKFESVYTGGTMDTVGGGEITQYWHCCGSDDPFDPGCEAAPHSTYDD